MKYIATLVTVLAFSLLKWFMPGEIKVTPTAPQKVNPGEEFTYEIKISKPGVSGFAKIQQELPQGFNAEAIDVKNASFSCVGGVVKLIWMSLPSENEFTISYKVKTDATTQGEISIPGKFSYLENNEKKTMEMPTTKITIGSSDAVASSDVKKETPAESNSSESATQSGTSDQTNTSDASAQQSASVVGNRTYTKVGEGKYKVELQIINNGLSGFAKAQDVLGTGMLAYEDNSGGAVYSFIGGKVKFVWMSVPDQKDIRVSYIVTAKTDDEMKAITGEFSYLENNETKRVDINTSGSASTPVLASNETTKTETPVVEKPRDEVKNTTTTTNTANTTNIQDKPKENTTASNTKPTNTTKPSNNSTGSSITSIPPAQNGVAYRVQICAGKNNIGNVANYFSNVYKFSEETVYTENHEGWVKYTIGSFTNYKSARDRRNEVTSKYTFPGPFVSAYNNGQRVTVQEALMVSRDKWVP